MSTRAMFQTLPHDPPRSDNGTPVCIGDNYAVLRGFTREIMAEGGDYLLTLSVRPDADLDGTFEAYDHDEMVFLSVNGWLFSIEDGHE